MLTYEIMDSITQFVLGAAVGQIVLGPKLGRKAALIGGLGATLPDLDGIVLSKLDMVSQLVYHRGVSHSIIFCIIAPFLLSPICQKLTKAVASVKIWYLFWFLVFFTHTILDCFTSWGTQLFWPHPYRVALNSIFIIDPFYTIPLVIGVIRTFRIKALKPVYIGVLISTMYVLTTLGIKVHVNHQFEKGLKKQSISITNYMTKPTPFNCFLWAITADVGDHYVYGYYSIFDKKPPSLFIESEPKNHEDLSPYKDNKSLRQLLYFTRGYYIVQPQKSDEDTFFKIFDTRYGRFGDWDPKNKGVYIFTYMFNAKTNGFDQTRPPVDNMKELMGTLLKRI